MKKYIVTLVFIACFFIENPVYADSYFVDPPYSIPYTVNGHTYDQIVQQIWTSDLVNDHNWQQVHYCNSNYFSIAKPILSALDNSHNTFALWLFTIDWPNMYNSDTDAFDYDLVMGNASSDNPEFCIVYYTTDGGSNWTENTLGSMPPSSDLYGDFRYTDYIRSTFDLYWSSQPFTPSNSYYNNQFQDGLSRKTNRLIIPASSFGGQTASTPLKFPFSAPATAYTAPVSSVMDQSTLGQGVPYAKGINGVVLAFNGEKGDVRNGCWCYATNAACNSSNYKNCNTVGFKKLDGKPFFQDTTGKKLIVYPFDLSKPNGSNDTFLFYDGHPGYDYPAPLNTKIFAPANGTLCIASPTKTSKPKIANVWRNTTYCPYPTAGGGTTWEGYHTFYVIHKDLRINGITNDYMTVFLHNNALDSTIQTKIIQSGYVNVTKDTPIALVGKFSPNKIGPHMHLEVYKKNDTKWDRVDPYGNGIQNILWEQ